MRFEGRVWIVGHTTSTRTGGTDMLVTRLNAELVKLLHTAEVKEQLAKLGAVPVGDSPEQFGAFVKAESQRWGKIIKDLGIKPE